MEGFAAFAGAYGVLLVVEGTEIVGFAFEADLRNPFGLFQLRGG